MSAAARLRRLDERARIIVLERGPHVSFANCGLPYHLSGEIPEESALLLHTPQSLAATAALDVRPRHEVTSLDPMAKTVRVRTPDQDFDLAYDALVLSPGAVAARPPIPGLDHPRVHTLRTIPDVRALRTLIDDGAGHAVVLGAGFIGLEAAESLRARGLTVSLIEPAPHILPPLEPELAWELTRELRALGIALHTAITPTTITDDDGRPVVHLSDGDAVVADFVLLSAGAVPDTRVFEEAGVTCERGAILTDPHGRTNLPDVYAVGDATLSTDAVLGTRRPIPLAGPANRAGRLVADALHAAQTTPHPTPAFPRPIPPALGTAIVRIGGLTAALTGANRAGLRAQGRDFETIHVHPPHHAGYFPGATPIHLLLHMDPATGEILGAQGVGANGVDKRIDVLATAMRGGLRAPDLVDLDLAYAPPYGSARDPITMLGLVADNVMTGQTTLWQAENLETVRREALLLDARSPAEFATGHLREAVNIPHTSIRACLEDIRALAAGRHVAVMCRSGVRSYLAHRILAAAGIASSTLSGGMLTLRACLGDHAHPALISQEPT